LSPGVAPTILAGKRFRTSDEGKIMIWDDLKKLLTSPTLFRLDAILSPRLVPLVYVVGLVAIILWAVDHLFASFAFNFGQGLWGILEIVVYGALLLLLLRVFCEGLLVFFQSHNAATETVARSRLSASLLDEVADAIHDLAEDDDDGISPATDPAPYVPNPTPLADIDPESPMRGPVIKRTAKRTPPMP
jgi:hypothetical protein